ncbi:MAG: hypothetical protein GY928_08630 [Colwellia sp.]|nr:hypothetical protein [Colwellia sp.]
MLERWHRTIISQLAKRSELNYNKWSTYINELLRYNRIQPNTNTKATPMELMFNTTNKDVNLNGKDKANLAENNIVMKNAENKNTANNAANSRYLPTDTKVSIKQN